MSNSIQINGTSRSSHLSPISATTSPTWAPPRAPLPPHRLAKLANALGVSTPMPAVHHPSPFMSHSYSGPPASSAFPDHFRRSPTPSTASTNNFGSYSQSTSKYLLHVIPPLHLPHESNSLDNFELTPPPPNASGYHTQFRRGTLVPVHATLQSQLGAIAKEYALPSTSGLILYLVTSATTSSPGTSQYEDLEEPGPRLSEDIWKHLWTRVLKAEQRDENVAFASRSPTPNMYGLGIGVGAHSSSYLPQDSNGPPLRPLISNISAEPHQPQAYPFTPPSTASPTSDLRSQTKSAPPSSSSVSQSEPVTPDSSAHESTHFANELDLPGLNSPSLIPILAKVEFDIDRRRAGWYEPWLRSRRMNHAKRAESRASRKASMNDGAEGSAEEGEEKKAPLDLKLSGRTQTASPVSFSFSVAQETGDAGDIEPETAGYEPLSESLEDTESEGGDLEQEDEYEDDSTARVASIPEDKDPLADVFGADADTWSELHDSRYRNSQRISNPNVVELALTGAELVPLPDQSFEEEEGGMKEEDEVMELLEQMSRPQLSLSIPSSPPTAPNKRGSSPTTQGTIKKHIPPPLVLHATNSSISGDLVVPPEASPMPSSAGSTNLPYLHGSSSDELISAEPAQNEEDEYDDDFTRVRSPAESEKRGGGVFDDLDLGLELSEDFDDNDPHDRRKSQYLMKAQLDEIERTLAQFSPRKLKVDLEEEQAAPLHSASLSVHSPSGLRNSDVLPPTPGFSQSLPQHDSIRNSDLPQQSWPAVPFSSLSETPGTPQSSRSAGLPPSPPQLAVNGVTTSAPKSYMSRSMSSTDVSAETESRKRELEEQDASYPAFTPSVAPSSSNSPVIPLSPDPFGRYPSSIETPAGSRQSSTYWDSVPIGHISPQPLDQVAELPNPTPREQTRRSEAPSSRFSADSVPGEEVGPRPSKGGNSTLITVKNIKKFWRKSNKTSVSGVSPTPSLGRSSPQLVPQRPERPSEDYLELPSMSNLPTTPTFGRFSPQLAPRSERSSQDGAEVPPSARPSLAPPVTAQHMRGDSSLDRFHFDQESPYPTRRSPSARYSPQPPSPALAPPMPTPPTPAPPTPAPPAPAPSAPAPPAPSSVVSIHPVPEKEKNSVRKSILKSWKSAAGSISQNSSNSSEPRSSIDRSNPNGTARPRRPSVLNFGPPRSAVTSPPPDIPPSPRIPEQFINARTNGTAPDRRSVRSKQSSLGSSHSSPPPTTTSLMTRSSSPPRSMASSRESEESRPSFDVSQFEIVSPKMNSTLSYPYHGLDHD